VSELVVSTECPTCAAPLDFTAGVNAIRCGHCGATLLVTGRKQTLAYTIAVRTTAARAMARVREASGRPPHGPARLYFVPYYRLTGHEFRWQRPPDPSQTAREAAVAAIVTRVERRAGRAADELEATLVWASGFLARLFGDDEGPPRVVVPAVPRPAGSVSLGASRARRGPALAFQDRYVDRSFLAADAGEIGLPSLGVRTGVLKVALFRRAALERQGRVAPVDMAVDAALATGMDAPDADAVVHRTVIGRVLSIIYFPVWVVARDAGPTSPLAVVDGVAETVTALEAPASLAARLDRAGDGEREIVGFRPLLCPNCGWDLPVAAEDVIFVCAQCLRTWQIHGARLSAVPAEVADVPAAGRSPEVRHLPFWVFETDGTPARLFAPAFRFRRLKVLSDLARSFSRTQPAYERVEGPRPALHGCHYDAEDALLLARFTLAGLDAGAPAPDVRAARLTWFPFRRHQRALVDPFTRITLPEASLG
jgi:LSD1 subclass zinc finger protein